MEQPFLYHHALSFGSQMARLVLAEKGVAWDGRQVDIGPLHQNYRHWYMNISLDGEVPVLVHDKEYIRGEFAVAKYVNRHFAGPDLVPRNPREEAISQRWIREVENFPVQAFSYAVAPGLMGVIARSSFRRSFPVLKKYRQKAQRIHQNELVEAYDKVLNKLGNWRRAIADRQGVVEQTEQLKGLLDKLEHQLEGRQWIAETFSLADVVWAVFLARLDLLGFAGEWKKNRRPHLNRYYRQLRKRRACRKAYVYRRVPLVKVLPSLVRGYGRTLLVFALILIILVTWSV